MPNILKPDFAKLDIRKLQADIPKYPKAGVPNDKMLFWQTIGDHLQMMEAKSREPPSSQWVLDTLQKRKLSYNEPNSTSALLPEVLALVCGKQTAPLPEVNNRYSICMQLRVVSTAFFLAQIYVGKRKPKVRQEEVSISLYE